MTENQENTSLNGTPVESGETVVRKAKAPAKRKSVKVQAPDASGEAQAVTHESTTTATPATAPAARAWTGPEPTTMEELLAFAGAPIKNLKSGDVLDGTVVRVDSDEVLVDIGGKSEGVVSSRELHGRNGEEGPALNVGDTVLVPTAPAASGWPPI